MRHRRARWTTRLLLAAACALPRGLAAQTMPAPPQAWAQVKQHVSDVDSYATTIYNPAYQLLNILRSVSPAMSGTATDYQAFLGFLQNEHRSSGNVIITGVDAATRVATRGFDVLQNSRARFLELANQMTANPTPATEAEFKQNLVVFANTLSELDRSFVTVSNRLNRYDTQCPRHANITARFSDSISKAINTFYADAKYARDRAANQTRRLQVFTVFGRWDAAQPNVVRSVNVVTGDWGRIHSDTEGLVAFIRKPDFVADLPHVDAEEVTGTIDRIRGYLATYR